MLTGVPIDALLELQHVTDAFATRISRLVDDHGGLPLKLRERITIIMDELDPTLAARALPFIIKYIANEQNVTTSRANIHVPDRISLMPPVIKYNGTTLEPTAEVTTLQVLLDNLGITPRERAVVAESGGPAALAT